MKLSRNLSLAGAALFVSLLTGMPASAAPGEGATPEKSQALLQKVKQGDLDRQINARQTEIKRLNEDLLKSKTEKDGLQQTIDATASLGTESAQNLEKLLVERKRLQHALSVATQNIEAERLRAEGLQALSEAQTKSLAALTKRIEEINIASSVQAEESRLLSEGKPLPDEDTSGQRRSELVQLRKSFATAALSTGTQEKAARTAMKAAGAKLEIADLAAAKAQHMASEPPGPVEEKSAAAEKKTFSIPNEIAPPKAISLGPPASRASAPTPKGGVIKIQKGPPVISPPKR